MNNIFPILVEAGFANVTLGRKIKCSCPFHQYTNSHKNGDKNPSFTIFQGNVVDALLYTCTCGETGKVSNLFLRLGDHALANGDADSLSKFENAREALKQLQTNPNTSGDTNTSTTIKKTPKAPFSPFPDSFLESFPKIINPDGYCIEAVDYLLSRGITSEQMFDLDVRVDTKRDMVMFPYYAKNGQLAGMRGRSFLTDDKERELINLKNNLLPDTKHYAYTYKGDFNKDIWFLESIIFEDDLDFKNVPTIVVESAIDAILLGGAATAFLGLNLQSIEKYAFFKGSAGVIWLGDGDRKGNDESKAVSDARELARSFCKQLNVPFYDYYMPVGYKDIGEMAQKDIQLVYDFSNTIYNQYNDGVLVNTSC